MILMALAAIPFLVSQDTAGSELAGAAPLITNAAADERGTIYLRPGLVAWSGFPTTIPEAFTVTGMGEFEGDLYYTTSQRRIWRVRSGSASAFTTGASSTFLEGSERPVFAKTKYRLVITSGRAPQKVESGASAAARLGGSPPNAQHVAAIAQRLFIDDDTSTDQIGQVRYSGTGDSGNETWDALNFFEAEAKPDDVVAIRENTNELFVFGESSLQVYVPDAVAVMAPGRTVNVGCGAGHSVIDFDDAMAWLDDRRRFVISDGREYQEISGPIANTLESLTTVSDCYGFRVQEGRFDILVWFFPTDGRAFAWQKGIGWSQWHQYDPSLGHTAIPVQSHFFWASENLNLVGLSTGRIVKFDDQAFDDLGTPFKAEIRTGFVNRETTSQKWCKLVRFRFKRGQTATGTTAPQVAISYRDDLGDFGRPETFSLGNVGDYNPSIELRSLGTYRERQWKLEFSGSVDLGFVGAEEDFEVLGV